MGLQQVFSHSLVWDKRYDIWEAWNQMRCQSPNFFWWSSLGLVVGTQDQHPMLYRFRLFAVNSNPTSPRMCTRNGRDPKKLHWAGASISRSHQIWNHRWDGSWPTTSFFFATQKITGGESSISGTPPNFLKFWDTLHIQVTLYYQWVLLYKFSQMPPNHAARRLKVSWAAKSKMVRGKKKRTAGLRSIRQQPTGSRVFLVSVLLMVEFLKVGNWLMDVNEL